MNETIGNRISKYRKARNLTQEELAEKLGVSSQAVSKWENDASCPDISLLSSLCRVLGITTDELLIGETQPVRMLPGEARKPLEALTLRIYISSADGDKVKLNLPMPLVKIAMEMGVDITAAVGKKEAVQNLDIGKIIDLVEQGIIGKLLEIESADGDTVEVVVA